MPDVHCYVAHTQRVASRFLFRVSSATHPARHPFAFPSLGAYCGNRYGLHNFPRASANVRKIVTLIQPACVMGVLVRGPWKTLVLVLQRLSRGEIVRLCMEIRMPPAPKAHTHARVFTHTYTRTYMHINTHTYDTHTSTKRDLDSCANFKRQLSERETEIG